MNGLSFDVEDWFHVQNYAGVIDRSDWDQYDLRVVDNTNQILRILKAHDTKATFFVLGWVARRAPEIVAMIRADDHEIGTHGFGHERVSELDAEQFRRDIEDSFEALIQGGASPGEIRGYRAPSFSIDSQNHWAFDVLREAGLAYDSSVYPTSLHPDYGVRDAPVEPFEIREGLWELPLMVFPLLGQRIPLAGGGPFRLSPYWLARRALQSVNERGRGGIMYFHPWEFDPGQPRVAATAYRRWRHRVNIDLMQDRLHRLLEDFDFVPLGRIASEREGSRLPSSQSKLLEDKND